MKIYGYYNKITRKGTLIKIPQLANLKNNSTLKLYINKFIRKFNYNCFQNLMNPDYIKISEIPTLSYHFVVSVVFVSWYDLFKSNR